MTTYDVKNYIEKIYKVPVLSVRCELIRGMCNTGYVSVRCILFFSKFIFVVLQV